MSSGITVLLLINSSLIQEEYDQSSFGYKSDETNEQHTLIRLKVIYRKFAYEDSGL